MTAQIDAGLGNREQVRIKCTVRNNQKGRGMGHFKETFHFKVYTYHSAIPDLHGRRRRMMFDPRCDCNGCLPILVWQH
eukprot:4411973-Ditylum_brightwellii.AAC.1